ncbi:Leucine Rich repeats (2 copies) [Planctomycetes bacterium CA13]|uniref:Leucine Rich repeats (2 copies) n=1 Tax=Novipirellula herctigrandis TaxID=2527986 RepID=A0A5C5YV62_9BACT|nr:Leucine Rich repeats (2 copies) [Planctomycetes bacterium CA13]
MYRTATANVTVPSVRACNPIRLAICLSVFLAMMLLVVSERTLAESVFSPLPGTDNMGFLIRFKAFDSTNPIRRCSVQMRAYGSFNGLVFEGTAAGNGDNFEGKYDYDSTLVAKWNPTFTKIESFRVNRVERFQDETVRYDIQGNDISLSSYSSTGNKTLTYTLKGSDIAASITRCVVTISRSKGDQPDLRSTRASFIDGSIEFRLPGEKSDKRIQILPSKTKFGYGQVRILAFPKQEIRLLIPKGCYNIEFSPSDNPRKIELTCDEHGKATATIRYLVSNLQELNNVATTQIEGYQKAGPHWISFAKCQFNILHNWQRLIAEFRDESRCRAAKSNPFIVSQMAFIGNDPNTALAGPLHNMLCSLQATRKTLNESLQRDGVEIPHVPFLTYEGMNVFTCQAYQRRLLSWFYNKRFSDSPWVASTVNGIECLPYSIVGGMHKFVGLMPAGISTNDRMVGASGTQIYLDPWWHQRPEVFSVDQMTASALAYPMVTLLTLPASAPVFILTGTALHVVAPAVAAMSNSQGEETWKEIAANIVGKSSASLTGRIDLDSDAFSILRKDMITFDDIETVRNQSTDFQIPSGPISDIGTGITGIQKWHQAIEDVETICDTIWMFRCPLEVTIATDNGSLTCDLVERRYEGAFPGWAISYPETDGSQGLILSVPRGVAQNLTVKVLRDAPRIDVTHASFSSNRASHFEILNANRQDEFRLNDFAMGNVSMTDAYSHQIPATETALLSPRVSMRETFETETSDSEARIKNARQSATKDGSGISEIVRRPPVVHRRQVVTPEQRESTISDLRNLGVDVLTSLSSADTVLSLDFRGLEIDDKHLMHLSDVDNKFFGIIFLNGCNVSDSGLMEIGKLQNLVFLGLDDTPITDDGIRHLANMPTLEHLCLSNTSVTDKCIPYLTMISSLKFLYLEETQITGAGAKEIQKYLPNCDITK